MGLDGIIHPRVTKWPLMEGPGPTFLLVTLYVLFVKKIGPAWMMDKKPYDLRYPMFLYNFVLVFTNFYLILEVSLKIFVINFNELLNGNTIVKIHKQN
ncbi:UNVERIFIED_CONTAM: Elongation of very long chain fatty acids protein 4 [Trichonephila clavipes]